ncbi:MAG: hypothetical protein GX121_07410 [Ignavibacteria bacterium]|nr:hypothetical protein [Ignavibacteria bacterium]
MQKFSKSPQPPFSKGEIYGDIVILSVAKNPVNPPCSLFQRGRFFLGGKHRTVLSPPLAGEKGVDFASDLPHLQGVADLELLPKFNLGRKFPSKIQFWKEGELKDPQISHTLKVWHIYAVQKPSDGLH